MSADRILICGTNVERECRCELEVFEYQDGSGYCLGAWTYDDIVHVAENLETEHQAIALAVALVEEDGGTAMVVAEHGRTWEVVQ